MSGAVGTSGRSGAAGVARLMHVVMPVAQLARATTFYRNALGFSDADRGIDGSAGPMGTPPEQAVLRLGEQRVVLEASPSGRPYPEASRSWDLWFQHVAIVVGDMAAAYARLQSVGCVAISCDGPELLPASSGGVTAFKFRDPDGHPLELLQFPRGQEPAAWRGEAGMFLGVDHSAIAVSDAARSARFYEVLGFSKASAGINRGREQERLDDAPGVVVDVVGLAPGEVVTPHVELLGYRAPGDARPMPADAVPDDILATRLVLAVAGRDRVVAGLPADARLVSRRTGRTERVVLRDPDGHLLELVDAG